MQRMKNGHFAPGISGNPQGRPPIPAEIKAMFTDLVPEAIAALADALRSDDEKMRLQAAQAILDRGLGKPHQSASIETNELSASQAHLAALVSMASGTMLRLEAEEESRAKALVFATGAADADR